MKRLRIQSLKLIVPSPGTLGLFSAWAVGPWQWALQLKREVERCPKQPDPHLLPQLETRVGCKVGICICIRKLGMRAKNAFPTDKDN